ncbi:MAG: hypothetical protein METHAR1v1_370025 [Methanothrix sp.]|nr:MAG: hypothetical protein METHAR1v1_370025 [Methanothrix sp.]
MKLPSDKSRWGIQPGAILLNSPSPPEVREMEFGKIFLIKIIYIKYFYKSTFGTNKDYKLLNYK